MLVAIAGKKGSGKNTLARMLRELIPGAVELAFADPMKDFVAQVYDWPREKLEDLTFKETPDQRYVRLTRQDIIDLEWNDKIDAWHEAQEDGVSLVQHLDLTEAEYSDWVQSGEVHLTPRRALQWLGTEFGRRCYANTWVDLALRRVAELERTHPLVIVTDCRYENESRAVLAAGGYVVKVIRPGLPSTDTHASEREIDLLPWSFIVTNDEDLALLRSLAEGLVGRLRAAGLTNTTAPSGLVGHQVSLPTRVEALGDGAYRITAIGAELTVAAMQREAFETSKAKSWHDQDDQPPSEAKKLIATEMLRICELTDRIEAHRKGADADHPRARALRPYDVERLSDHQVLALQYLGLIASELAEAADDVLANRWETSLDEKGKPTGLGSEIADVLIRAGDHFSVFGIDLERELRRKFVFNRSRERLHGGKLA